MKVSIIIPVYNGEKYLNKCLDSIVNQTYDNLEIIIINDGSKDNSLKILKEYASKDNRIVIIDKTNEGQAVARNIALKKITGEYVLFIDCDDYIDLDMVEKTIELAKLENFDVCIYDTKEVSEKTGDIFTRKFDSITPDNKTNYILTQAGPVSKTFKTDLLRKNNFKFLENHIYEDLASIPYIGIMAKKISYLEGVSYYYLLRDGSTMNQIKYNKKLNDIFPALENLSKLFNNKYQDELEYIYIKHLLHAASLRFLKFNNKESKEALNKINKIMKEKYPNWNKNKYLFLFSKKEVLLLKIIYKKLYFVYNIYRKVVRSS